MPKNGIYLINGPNLNMLGMRDPALYGTLTLSDIACHLATIAKQQGFTIESHQSNHVGDLIDWIQKAAVKAAGIVLNAGGETHTSVSLRDAVNIAQGQGVPTAEVHLSNIHVRESFRHISLLSAHPSVVIGTYCGKQFESYVEGLQAVIDYIRSNQRE